MSRARDIANLQSSKITADFGIDIDNITIDGTEIDLSSGDLTIDVAGNISLDADDGGHVRFKDGGAEYLSIYEDASNNPIIQASIADTNILFKGTDGSSVITALDLDIANAGAATFGGAVNIGTTGSLSNNSGTFLIDANTNLNFRGGTQTFDNADGSVEYMRLNSTGLGIGTSPSNKLDIATSANAYAARITNNSDGSQGLQIRTSDNDGDLFILDLQSSTSATGTDYTSRFVVEKSGNVGIGSNDPHAILDVKTSTDGRVLFVNNSDDPDIVAVNNANSAYANLKLEGATVQFRIAGGGKGQFDSSGNFLVARTSVGISNTGHTLAADGYAEFTRNASSTSVGASVNIGRNTSDGKFIDFFIDGATKGYISYRGAELQIGQGNAALQFSNGSDAIVPANESGTANDDAIDLGLSSGRFKNFYLSRTATVGALNSYSTLRAGNTGRLNLEPSGNLTISFGGDSDSSYYAAIFANSSSTSVGYILVGSSATDYSTSSDYRLKENINYDWDATSRLKQLKPARFNFKTDPDKTIDGLIAHEVSEIVPNAVNGEKDEMKNGEPFYQGIDHSKLVPLLVKTIQELEARIAKLEGE